MINREDMMELTRRMTVSRSSMTRIAGSYMDEDGFIDGTFNVNFLNLKTGDKTKNLAIAKAIPFSETNTQLKRYRLSQNALKPGGICQLLSGMKSCGLKNDALMDVFYDLFAERYVSSHAYGVYVFHDRYDVPVKASDHERVGESEEVFEYIICAVCPVDGEYEPGLPECGFIYPAFSDRSADLAYIDVFHARGHHAEVLTVLGE